MSFETLLKKYLPDIEFIYNENGKAAIVNCMEIREQANIILMPDAYGPIVTRGKSIIKVVEAIKEFKPSGAVKAICWNGLERIPAFEHGKKKYVFISPQIHWLLKEKEGRERHKNWYVKTKQYKNTYEYWYNNIKKPTIKNWFLKLLGF